MFMMRTCSETNSRFQNSFKNVLGLLLQTGNWSQQQGCTTIAASTCRCFVDQAKETTCQINQTICSACDVEAWTEADSRMWTRTDGLLCQGL
jgi:hypothetical protein